MENKAHTASGPTLTKCGRNTRLYEKRNLLDLDPI